MEPIDELIRGAMPRAPRGIADAVERRLATRRRSRRALAGVGVMLAAAAALVLWLMARPAPAPGASTWVATRATAATLDGKPLAIGRALVAGAVVHVGDGGAARLERPSAGERAVVTLLANSEARVGEGALELLNGQARLEGPEARLTGEVAEVTTLGVGAAATVELRRNPMMTKNAAALAALLTVSVVDGGARVAAKGHAPLVLAKNDRTMIAPKLPPVTARAAAKTTAKTPAAKTPTPAPAATPGKPSDAPPAATADGEIDKDAFRAVVGRHIDEVRYCYEQALKDSPTLSGRIVVRMTLVTKDGVARVSDGEIEPRDDGDLQSLSLQSCVLQALSRWKFPASLDGGDVVVTYPFTFKTLDE